MLAGQLCEGRRLLRTVERRFGPLRQGEEEGSMASSDQVFLAARR